MWVQPHAYDTCMDLAMVNVTQRQDFRKLQFRIYLVPRVSHPIELGFEQPSHAA